VIPSDFQAMAMRMAALSQKRTSVRKVSMSDGPKGDLAV
jgi:hypothetical protein